jgi:hypothetical protein
MFYTIAPPPRCSIVRLLQWRTTLVKKRSDPSRYVIDLLNNPEAPASQHKVGSGMFVFVTLVAELPCALQTVKFYRRAILPLPKSMTPYLDKLRKQRKSEWAFVNSQGEPYSSSTFFSFPCRCRVVTYLRVCSTGAWTHFAKASFRKHSGDKKKAPSASLARSIFVTWLNGVPYDTRDSPFLDEMKLTAAEYQTHSLAIANTHYDKDAASEAKLRVLVDFCDAYAQWQPDPATAAAAAVVGAAPGGKEAKLSENLDSDDEKDYEETKLSSSPSAAQATAAAAVAVAVLIDKPGSGLADMQLGNDDDDPSEPLPHGDSFAGAAVGISSAAPAQVMALVLLPCRASRRPRLCLPLQLPRPNSRERPRSRPVQLCSARVLVQAELQLLLLRRNARGELGLCPRSKSGRLAN